MTRFVMPGLMALALILIVLNYVFDYLRSTDEPVINVPGLTTPVSPRASLGFRLGAQPAAVYRVQFLTAELGDGGGGMAVDRFERHSALPSMLFPATFKGQQSVDLLIFRPSFCSDKFLKAHVVTVPFTLETRAPAQTSALETVLRAANRALVSFGEAAAPPLWRED